MAQDDERVNEHLSAFGLRPSKKDLPAIRAVLAGEAARESAAYDEGGHADIDAGGDTELMKLCCVQLFNCGGLADTLLIWRAKEHCLWLRCTMKSPTMMAHP